MSAYIDEYRSRFGVAPICRVLGKSLDYGFLTPARLPHAQIQAY